MYKTHLSEHVESTCLRVYADFDAIIEQFDESFNSTEH